MLATDVRRAVEEAVAQLTTAEERLRAAAGLATGPTDTDMDIERQACDLADEVQDVRLRAHALSLT